MSEPQRHVVYIGRGQMSEPKRDVVYKHTERTKCHRTTEVCGLHRERTNVTEPQRHVVYIGSGQMSQNQRHVIYKHREDKCQNHRHVVYKHRERTDVTEPEACGLQNVQGCIWGHPRVADFLCHLNPKKS